MSEEFQEVTIQLPHIKLAGKLWGTESVESLIEKGADGKLALLLHGWLDNAASFDLLAPKLLCNDFAVLCIDLPGHGFSQHRSPDSHYHLFDSLYDVDALFSYFSPLKLFLIGHSLGAVMSVLYASARSDLITKLVLIEATGPYTGILKDTALQIRKALDKARSSGSQQRTYSTIEEAAEDRQKGFGTLTFEAAYKLVERNLKKVDGGFVWRSDPRLRRPSIIRMTEEQVLVSLQNVSVPTLLIAAEQGFVDISKENPRFDAPQNLRLVSVKGSHHTHLDGDVEVVAELINEFLSS